MTRRTLSGGKRRRRRRALVLEPAARVPKCARASGGSGVWGSGQRACIGVLGRFSLGLLTSNSSEIAGPYTCGGVSGRQLRAFVRLRLPPPLSREQGWLLHWPSAARRWAAFSYSCMVRFTNTLRINRTRVSLGRRAVVRPFETLGL